MLTTVAGLTRADYAAAFDAERDQVYPQVDALEARFCWGIDPPRLLEAARVLACPVKRTPPHWQHGRVLYAYARQYLARHDGPAHLVDIGTAKGFSALCLRWALSDSQVLGRVTSIDVIDPAARVRRNTVAELDGYLTLYETLAPWSEMRGTEFVCGEGLTWLQSSSSRIHMASIDGKHTEAVVREEALKLAERQQPGDLVFFDDVHLPGVAAAVRRVADVYDVLERFDVLPQRAYLVAVRR